MIYDLEKMSGNSTIINSKQIFRRKTNDSFPSIIFDPQKITKTTPLENHPSLPSKKIPLENS